MEKDEESGIGTHNMEKRPSSVLEQPVEPVHQQSSATEGQLEGEVRTEERKGIIFAEQTQRNELTIGKSRYHGTAEEKEWDMKNFFLVPVRVASGKWTQTQTPGTPLEEFDILQLHKDFSRWRQVINQYQYYRYRIKFRIELNGTAFHAGQLVFYWRYSKLGVTSPRLLKMIPHIDLYATYNTVGEIETQWFSPAEYGSTQSTLTQGRAGLVVFNMLTAGTGASTELNYTIYAQLLDVVLSLPRPVSGSAQGLINVQNITVTGNAPINTTGDSYDVRFSGLDLASNVKDPEKRLAWTVSNPFMVHGNPPVDRLSSYPSGVTLATQTTFNVDWDEMDIDNLKRLPGFLQKITLATSANFGTVLARGPCAPIPQFTQTLANYVATPLEWLASHFCNWRGDLEFCVEIISTQYHTGKIFFGINYTEDPVVDFSVSGVDPTTYYGKVIEINGKENCFQITVPYMHWSSWLDCMPNPGRWNLNDGVVANANTMMSYGTRVNEFRSNYYTLGEWFITVLNPLVVPSGVANQVDINVYLRGGENFEFHRPGFNGLWQAGVSQVDTIGNQKTKIHTTTPSQFIERPRSLRELLKRAVLMDAGLLAQTGTIASSSQAGCFMRTLYLDGLFNSSVPFANIMNAYNAYFGDLRIKIVVDFGPSATTASRVMQIGYFNRPNAPPHTGYFGGAKTAVLNQFSMYRNALYDITAKPQTNFATSMGNFGGGPDLGENPMGLGFECQHIITAASPAIEIEIPYYGILKHAVNRNQDPQWWQNAWGTLFYVQPAASAITAGQTGAMVFTYLYAGDSLRCGQFNGVPFLKNRRANNADSTSIYMGVSGPQPAPAAKEDEPFLCVDR